jgi:type IV secretory pathway TrbD component
MDRKLRESMARARRAERLAGDEAVPEDISMSDTPSRAEIEAQIAASEARSATGQTALLGEMRTSSAELRGEMRAGFAELRGEIAKIATRLDTVERTVGGTKTTVIATGIASVAVIIAVLTYGQTWFGIGVSARDVIRATVAEMQTTPR